MIPEAGTRDELREALVGCGTPRPGEVYRVRLSQGVVERWKVVRLSFSHRPESIIYERKAIVIPEQNFVTLGLDSVTLECWQLMASVYQLIYFGYDP